jgi:hypothetical protein
MQKTEPKAEEPAGRDKLAGSALGGGSSTSRRDTGQAKKLATDDEMTAENGGAIRSHPANRTRQGEPTGENLGDRSRLKDLRQTTDVTDPWCEEPLARNGPANWERELRVWAAAVSGGAWRSSGSQTSSGWSWNSGRIAPALDKEQRAPKNPALSDARFFWRYLNKSCCWSRFLIRCFFSVNGIPRSSLLIDDSFSWVLNRQGGRQLARSFAMRDRAVR